MNVNIQYDAIFEYANDGINIIFPDIPEAITCAYSKNEAIKMAKEVLTIVLQGKRYYKLPKLSNRSELNLLPNTEIINIKITMKEHEGLLYRSHD